MGWQKPTPIVKEFNATKPAHYNDRKINPYDVMDDSMGRERFIGFLEGNIIKYALRWDRKGTPVDDLGKVIAYTQKLLEVIQEEK